MINIIRNLIDEVSDSVIRPRIEKAKTDFRLAIITGAVLIIFSLLALVCLFVIIFLHLTEYMPPENAALALFGFCIIMCLGAVLMFVIGKRVEQRLFESRTAKPMRSFSRGDDGEDFDPSDYMRDLFANNKGAALIAAAVSGIVLGAKPRMVLRTASKLVAGKSFANKTLKRARRYSRK